MPTLRGALGEARRGVRALTKRRGGAFALTPAVALELAEPGVLTDLFFAHDSRLVHKWVQYLGVYEREFARYRNGFPSPSGLRPLRLLEIGVSQGGSLELWRKYFGPEATIFGIDVDPRCAQFDDDSGHVRIGSQADPDFLRRVVEEMGGVDIVLDDGSHVAKHQRTSFDALFPLLSFGGLYIVEDLQTAYWPGFSGGYRRPGTFIQVSKGLIDGMHSWYYRWPLSRRNRLAKTDIGSICFYDGIAVIAKCQRQRPGHVRVGRRSF